MLSTRDNHIMGYNSIVDLILLKIETWWPRCVNLEMYPPFGQYLLCPLQ